PPTPLHTLSLHDALPISIDGRGGLSGAAFLARAVHLDDRLCRGEVARRGDFFDQRLDVRAQEFGRAVADAADEMKVPRMTKSRRSEEHTSELQSLAYLVC